MASPWLIQSARETLLRAVETVLNRLLAADPESPQRLQRLAGCRLGVELTDIGLNLLVLFSESGLRFVTPAPDTDAAPAAWVRSSLADLLGLASSAGRRGAKVEFSGDVGVIQNVRRVFTELEVDWEEQISEFTGDMLAHQLGRAMRSSTNWLRHSGESMLQTIGEYLTEERRELPSAAEVSGFLTEVDYLRQDVEHLAVRLRRLEQGLDREAGR